MYTRIHRYLAGGIFLVSLMLYFKTMAPTVSFWDCGEFIATSYILGVPHPPGSPLYLLIGRAATMMPFMDDIAARVNFLSVMMSALAVMFLYLIIVQLLRKWRGPVESATEALVVFGGAIIGALTFMVTDSHWFNAVEAEVYAMSTFLTALVVWLILRWSQRDQGGSHVHYILLLAYILGLATGVHLLNLLALPFIALIIFIRRREFTLQGLIFTGGFTVTTFLIIYLGIIKGLPRLAEAMGLFSIVVPIAGIIAGTWWAIKRGKKNTRIIFTSLLLIVVGYSTYATIFIRSGQDPAIDENNPDNTRRALAYLEREQYGDWSLYDRARWTPATRNKYSGVSDFFWSYQIKKMYARYFLWQFAGRGPAGAEGVSPMGANPRQDGVDWRQFGLPLALLIGIFGIYYHFKNDWEHALALLSLFLATGLMIILYLNQADPQPRERDYAFIGSYFAFAVWIGIGMAGILDLIRKLYSDEKSGRIAVTAILGVMTIIMPLNMLRANYHTHDRTGNFVASDYSYNLLNSCQPNAIIFTNGDNDTFPLWYMQEVEGVRKDVRVINLSLLNTDWYISQLRTLEPKLPLTLSDQDIAQMTPIPWEAQEIKLAVPHPDYPEATLEWNLKPTYGGRFLRVQDRMIVQLIRDLKWSRPIYFAVTVAPESRLGLEKYMEMQGLVYQLMPIKVAGTNPELIEKNLLEVYRYRNLDNPDVYYNYNIHRLIQNVRSSYLQLSLDALMKGDKVTARRVMKGLSTNIPENVIPVNNKALYRQITFLYSETGDSVIVRSRIEDYVNKFKLTYQDSLELGMEYGRFLDDWDMADSIFEAIYKNHMGNGQFVGRLVEINAQAGRNLQARRYLGGWIASHPGDQGALAMLDSLSKP